MSNVRTPLLGNLAAMAAIAGGTAFAGTFPVHAGVKVGDGVQAIAVQPGANVREAKALTELGEKYLKGNGVPRDLAASVQYFRKAAELGDTRGMLRLGEALVHGRGVPVDRNAGLALIRTAAGRDSPAALMVLADLLAQGLAGPAERAQAVPLLVRAAALGAPAAFVKLGNIYQLGTAVSADPARAVAYYTQAIDKGRVDAMVALGRGYAERSLGTLGTPTQGIDLLTKALGLGSETAVIALSDCHIKGNGTAKDPAKAIALLRDAWEGGNIKAGVRLLSLYRDGRREAVRRDRFLAEYYARKVIPTLDEAEAATERLLMAAAYAKSPGDLKSVGDQFHALAQENRPGALKRLRATNPNAYVFLVQWRLGELNVYRGQLNGQLSASTVSAIYRYCVGQEDAAVCGKGPMSGRVIEVTANAF